ncbi:sodium:proton antiporter [uncultured Microscilla sp.]|uniref:cation:proton antiporter n=1 Tax=uncultured Microscilla sp. TaxID=432653 RepID=UPI002614BB12|nr:sodium:proton antiporter [uncultured Microscilla sp.]
MDLFNAFTILIVLSAAFGYINHRYLKLPTTIGLMIISLVMSLGIVILGTFSKSLYTQLVGMIKSVDFNKVLMEIMLSFLLFAGALHVDVKTLAKERNPIMVFATLGVLTSTFIVGSLMYYVFQLLGTPIDYIYCLLFGSLISPTDPIAVLAILKKATVPKKLEVKISGESLFNDGVAVVIFLSIFEMADKGIDKIGATDILFLFVTEAAGGALFGLLLGYTGYVLLKSIDSYIEEVLITLALVMGGYAFSSFIHISGPLAVVVAGLVMSDRARMFAMSDITRQYVDMFWEILDEVFNAVLFILIGLEVLVISFNQSYIIAGVIAIVVVLVSRFISVGIPISLMKLKRSFIPRSIQILTWGGLRGGISVALALSLTDKMHREEFVTITYIVVVFSIIVQGLTIGKLVQGVKEEDTEEVPSGH